MKLWTCFVFFEIVDVFFVCVPIKIIKTSDLKLGQLVEKLTCFVEKDHISWTSPCINISMVLSRAVNYFVLLQVCNTKTLVPFFSF